MNMNTQNKTKIARVWHGAVPEGRSEEYYQYLQETGLRDYTSIEGNCGAWVLRRQEEGKTHFLLITLWDSYSSIRKFAGKKLERARYYPEDEKYLIKKEPYVKHYEVFL